MAKVGLKVNAINASTRDEASRLRNEELWVTARTHGNVVLAGPEQLTCAEFEKAVRDDIFWARTCGLGFDEVHLLNVWGRQFRKDFLQMGFVKARLNDTHCPWILTSATIRQVIPYNNICHLLGLRSTRLHVIRRSNFRPEIQLLFRTLSSPIDGDSFLELDWVLMSGRTTLIFCKTISLGTRIHAHLFNQSPPGNRDQNIRLYNSLNWDDHNAETRELLAGIPGESAYCQIGIGTDTLSVGVDMPAIADGILVGDIDDSDEAFQKFGRLARRSGLVLNPRGIVYTTPAALEAAEQAMAAAKHDEGENSKTCVPVTDLSWPTMLTAKCKSKGQHKLYNEGIVYVACLCEVCISLPPPLINNDCNCSGCIPEKIPTISKPPPPPTDLSQIPTKDRISTVARAHGIATLTKFRKDVWRADTSNLLLHPEVYLSDRLMKEILDKFSLLKSLEAVKIMLAPYERLRNQESTLFDILTALQVDFDRFAAEKKAEAAAKRIAATAAKAAQKGTAQVQEISATSEDEQIDAIISDAAVAEHQDIGSNSATPSDQQAL
jgi:hypothetical protein